MSYVPSPKTSPEPVFCMYTIVKMVSKTDGPSQRSVGQCLQGPYKNVGESANVRHLAHLQTTKATK